MTAYVVDASVVAAWFLPPKYEPLSTQAVRIQDQFVAGLLTLIAPDLLHPELGHVLAKATRSGRIARQDATNAVETFLDFGIPTISTRDLLRQAAHLAHATGCSVYDGMYVALALVSGHPLLTADERLANALSPRFPVHWLGLI